MYSSELIRAIYQRLAAQIPQALVLWGGSYWYGEAREDSDIDFYCVVSWFKVRQAQRLAQSVVNNYPGIKLSVMILPRLFYQHGWYYIDGVDKTGARHTSPFNKTIVIRNCLKLAWWHYLGARVAPDAFRRDQRLNKARHQLAVALELMAGRQAEPIFSRRALAPTIASLQLQDLRASLEEATRKAQPYLSFSLANYLIYNLKFMPRGRGLFLFKNPDKMILEQLQTGLRAERDLVTLEKTVRQVVFPVITV